MICRNAFATPLLCTVQCGSADLATVDCYIDTNKQCITFVPKATNQGVVGSSPAGRAKYQRVSDD